MRVGPLGPAMPLRIELTGLDPPIDPRRIGQIVDIAIEHQHRGPQPVAIFDGEERRILAMVLHRPLGFVRNLGARRLR